MDHGGFLGDVEEGEAGGLEEAVGAVDEADDADHADDEADGDDEQLIVAEIGGGSAHRADDGDDGGAGKASHGDIDGAQGVEQEDALALDAADLVEQESVEVRGELAGLELVGEGAHAVAGAEEAVAGAEREDGSGVGEQRGGGDDGEDREGVGGKVHGGRLGLPRLFGQWERVIVG